MDNMKIAHQKLLAKIATLTDDGEVDSAVFAEYKDKFVKALDNDLNTSLAVTAIYDVLKAKTNGATKRALLADFDNVLALDLLASAEKLNAAPAAAPTVSSDDPFIREIEELIEARKNAKKEKNYAEADRIRAYLLEKGVTLIDTKEGTSYQVNQG
jgi:cysteinyl-tRNA synthetase